jgi:hypothetical protein
MTNGLGWLSKKIKKLSQKGLTNRPFCGIINIEKTKRGKKNGIDRTL